MAISLKNLLSSVFVLKVKLFTACRTVRIITQLHWHSGYDCEDWWNRPHDNDDYSRYKKSFRANRFQQSEWIKSHRWNLQDKLKDAKYCFIILNQTIFNNNTKCNLQVVLSWQGLKRENFSNSVHRYRLTEFSLVHSLTIHAHFHSSKKSIRFSRVFVSWVCKKINNKIRFRKSRPMLKQNFYPNLQLFCTITFRQNNFQINRRSKHQKMFFEKVDWNLQVRHG